MNDKYYLLIFNSDFADEHSVPALACFPEAAYLRWLRDSMLFNINENYEEEIKLYNERVDTYHKNVQLYNERGLMRKLPKDFTEEDKEFRAQHPLEYISSRDRPKKGTSYITAYLGNGGDSFEDGYDIYETGQAFVDANVVKVMEVSQDFYDTFHTAQLDSLSLCNIFEIEKDEDY